MKNNELETKLKQDIDTCDWDSLAPHFERGAILIVDSSLDLSEVGVALATDNTELVKPWIESKQIVQPSMSDKEKWEQSPKEKFAEFLILQPYVLIQLKN